MDNQDLLAIIGTVPCGDGSHRRCSRTVVERTLGQGLVLIPQHTETAVNIEDGTVVLRLALDRDSGGEHRPVHLAAQLAVGERRTVGVPHDRCADIFIAVGLGTPVAEFLALVDVRLAARRKENRTGEFHLGHTLSEIVPGPVLVVVGEFSGLDVVGAVARVEFLIALYRADEGTSVTVVDAVLQPPPETELKEGRNAFVVRRDLGGVAELLAHHVEVTLAAGGLVGGVAAVVELLQECRVLVRIGVVVDVLDSVQTEAVHSHPDPLVSGLADGLESCGLLAGGRGAVVQVGEPVCPEMRVVHRRGHSRQNDVLSVGVRKRERNAIGKLVLSGRSAILVGVPLGLAGSHKHAPGGFKLQ